MTDQSYISSYASSDIFVLLSWTCHLYSVCLQANPDFTSTQFWRLLTGCLATLLDAILNESTRAKSSMRKGALVRTRRMLRSVPDKLPVLMTTLLSQAKSSQIPLCFVPLIGVAVDVTVRLKNVKDESLTHLSIDAQVHLLPSGRQYGDLTFSFQNDILALYANSILMSKVPVPSHTIVYHPKFLSQRISIHCIIFCRLPCTTSSKHTSYQTNSPTQFSPQ